jgi:hypothetical protein
MTRFTTRRGLVGGLVLAVVLAGAAFAYWTAGGSGSGSGSAATGATGLTARQTTVLTPMFPGDSAQTISGTFDNPNTGPTFVGSVTVSIASVVKAGGAPAGTCDASDFTLANTAMAVNAQIPAGTSQGSFTGATIQFNNKPTTNQDACKGATVNLSYTIA